MRASFQEPAKKLNCILGQTLSAHRAECEKIAEQTRVIADFLAVHAAAQSDADLPTLKRFVELEKCVTLDPFVLPSILLITHRDMQNTLDDLSRIASRSPPIPRQASQSPPPYARDAQPAASAVQITLPARSRSPIAALKRVTWSIAGDFEVARCTERLQHAHRILTVCSIRPSAMEHL